MILSKFIDGAYALRRIAEHYNAGHGAEEKLEQIMNARWDELTFEKVLEAFATPTLELDQITMIYFAGEASEGAASRSTAIQGLLDNGLRAVFQDLDLRIELGKIFFIHGE